MFGNNKKNIVASSLSLQIVCILIFLSCTSTQQQDEQLDGSSVGNEELDAGDINATNENPLQSENDQENNFSSEIDEFSKDPSNRNNYDINIEYSGNTANKSAESVANNESYQQDNYSENDSALDSQESLNSQGISERNPFSNQQIQTSGANAIAGFDNQQLQVTASENIPVNSGIQGSVSNIPVGEAAVNINSLGSPIPPHSMPEVAKSTTTQGMLPSYEIFPSRAMLWWVGFDYQEQNSLVRVELMTRGAPQYDLFQQKNKAGQPELLVRYYNTVLRKKINRALDASEFRSPVAFIRMEENREEERVDVILTMRDMVSPKMYTRDGNVLLIFSIPEKYKGNVDTNDISSNEAKLLTSGNIRPALIGGSEFPKSQPRPRVPDPGEGAFAAVPDAGVSEVTELAPLNNVVTESDGLPEDFSYETNAVSSSIANNVSNEGSQQDSAENLSNQSKYSEGNNSSIKTSGGENEQGNSAQYDQQNYNQQNYNQEYQNYNQKNGQQYQEQYQQQNNQDNQFNNNGDQFEEDKIDNFDDGDGDSDSDIEKFEVKNESNTGKYAVLPFSLMAVSQDQGQEGLANDFDDDYENYSNIQENDQEQDNSQPDNYIEAAGQSQGVENDNTFQNNVGTSNVEVGANTGNYQGTVENGLQETSAEYGNNGTDYYGNATNSTPDLDIFASENSTTLGPEASNQSAIAPVNSEAPVDLGADDVIGQESGVGQGSQSGYHPVRLEFKGARLKEVIRTLAEENNINFTFTGDIGEKAIYMSFKDIPWDDALRAVLETNGLGMVKLPGGVIRIDSLVKLTKEKDELFKIRESATKLIPTKVLVLRLSYAKAEDVKKLVDGMLESSKFDKRVRVDIDVRTNSVIVEATPADLSKVVSLVERVDLQTPQVKVASRIVEVLRSKKNLFGIDWSGPIMGDQGRGLGFGNLVFPNYALSTFAIDTGAASNSATGTGVNLHLGSINNSVELDARLRMEESLGTTNILQNNNVIVADNEKATIKVGRQDFFVTPAAGEGQNPGFNVVDYLLVLQATPHITADGAIQMNVEIESSSPVAKITPDAQASRSQRLLQTSFIKQSGETAAIGGLYTTEVSEEVFGVPILSKIPIIGALFRSSKKSDDRRELIVLVTPTVISGLGQRTGPTVTQASNQGEFNSLDTPSNISNSGVPGNVTASQLGGNYDYGENGEYTDGSYENQQNGQQEEVNQQYGDYEEQGQEAQQQSQEQGQYQNQTYQDQQGTQQQQGYGY